MEEIFEDLIKKIITKEELILFLEEINRTKQYVFKNVDTPLSERVKGKTREGFRNYLKKLEKSGSISGPPNQQFSFFEEIEKCLREVPQIKLEIAFAPSEDFLLKIKKWFREENRQEVILDLTVNHRITGGAIIEYQGQYRNFSLAKRIDELVSQNHG